MLKLVIEISKEANRLKMSASERVKGIDSTLRHHEDCIILDEDIKILSERIVEVFNKTLGKVDDKYFEEFRKDARSLFDQLFTPDVKKAIKSTKANFLLISIDEQLVHIPWELLYDGEQFLCLRFATGRTVRTKQKVIDSHKPEIVGPAKMLIVADPCGDLSYSYEEGIALRDELDKQQSKVKVVSKTGVVSLDFVKRNIRDYDIVHFAGHAEYDLIEPSKSGWILKDGKFTSRDIVTLGATAPMPSVVFSNACQSGKTQEWNICDGLEGVVYGLANAFLLSGAKHYIGTFWQVEDKTCLDFASQFYKNILSGLPIGEALRIARINLFNKGNKCSISWASYLLYGDPTIALFAPKARNLKPFLFAKVLIIALAICFVGIKASNLFRSPKIAVTKIENSDTKENNFYLVHIVSSNLSQLSGVNPTDITLLLNPEELVKKTTKEIGKSFGIDLAIEASYRDFDGKLKVRLSLVSPQDGKVYGAREFTVNNEIALETEITSNLISMLKLHSPKNKSNFEYPGTSNVGAYNLFSRTWELYKNGNYKEVIALCIRALELDPEYLDVYKRLGNSYDIIGNKEAALKTYLEYARLSDNKKDSVNLANALINIGWIYHFNKDFEKAYDFYKQGATKAIEANDRLREAKAYRQMGIWYRDKGQYSSSSSLLVKSLAINKSEMADNNHKFDLACDYLEIGLLLSNKSEHEKALSNFMKSMKIFASIGEQIQVNKVRRYISKEYLNLGDISLKSRDCKKARFYYNKAFKSYDLADSKAGLAVTHRCIGDVYFGNGDFDNAIASYSKSLEIFLSLKGEEARAGEMYVKIGKLHYKKGAYGIATEYFNKALLEYTNSNSPGKEQSVQEIKEILEEMKKNKAE